MSKKTFAYIRVLIKDQIEARQLKEILELGINERDLLYVKSIGRFGRNSKEIKKEWEEKDVAQNVKAEVFIVTNF